MRWRLIAWTVAGALVAIGIVGWALMRNGATARPGLTSAEEHVLFPAAADLTAPRTQQMSDGELYHVTAHGVRFTAMPAMGLHADPAELWKLVALVRELPYLDADALKAADADDGHDDDMPRGL
jgi:hypothetical protein